MQEITDHLLTECNFSEAVWDKVAADCQTHPAVTPFQKGDIKGWLSATNHAGSKSEQQINVGVVFFFWWFIWKERNYMIFDNKE
jgi:hypothetical protein